MSGEQKKSLAFPLSIASQLTLSLTIVNQDEQIQSYQYTDFRFAWCSFLMVYRCLLQNNSGLFIKTITLIFNHVHSLKSTNINNSFVCVCVEEGEKSCHILFNVKVLSVLGGEIKLSEQILPWRSVLNRKICYCITIY